jgi:hypothetical protein
MMEQATHPAGAPAGEATAIQPADLPRLPPIDPAQLLLVLNRARYQTFALCLRSGVWLEEVRCVGLTIIYTWQGKVVSFRVRVPTPNGDRELWLDGSVVAEVLWPEEALEADMSYPMPPQP